MSNVDAPNVNADGETTNQELVVEQSGIPAMTKKFTIETDTEILGDLDVTGTVTATSFIGDGSQLTGISGGGGPQSEIIDGNAFVRIEEGNPDGDSAAPVNLKMVSVGGTDLWDVDVSTLNDVTITTGDDIGLNAGDDVDISAAENVNITSVGYMDLISEDNIYLTAEGKIDLETSEYIELNGDVYVRDHTLRLQDDFAGVNPGMESFVQDLSAASSTQVPSSIAVKSVTDDLQSQINNLSGGGGLDSAAVSVVVDETVNDPTTLVLGSSSNSGVGIGSGATTNSLSGGSVSIGTNANSYIQSVAIGSTSTASGTGSVAIGPNSGGTGNFITAVGRQATTSGSNSVALGYSADAGNYGIALGDAVSGQRSIAIGALASATNDGALHINANYNSGVGPSANGGLVIETSSARLEYSADSDWTFGAGVTMTDLTASGATVVFSNLPTTDPVNAGQLWNDAGTLKISAG